MSDFDRNLFRAGVIFSGVFMLLGVVGDEPWFALWNAFCGCLCAHVLVSR